MSEATSTDERMSALEAQLAHFAVQLNETTAQLRKVEEERDEYRKLVLHLKEENERLRRGLLGQKSERLPRNDAQLSLAILGMAMAGADSSSEAETAAAAVEKQLVKQHTRCKPVRKPLPAELPRVEIEQNLGYEVGRSTIQRILQENGIDPARLRGMSWGKFIEAHMGAIAGIDFFTVEVVTLLGLIRYHVFFAIDIAGRTVEVAGVVHRRADASSSAALAMSLEWFEVEFHSVVFDMDDDEIEHELL